MCLISLLICFCFVYSDLPTPVAVALPPDSPTQELDSILEDLMGLAEGVSTKLLERLFPKIDINYCNSFFVPIKISHSKVISVEKNKQIVLSYNQN